MERRHINLTKSMNYFELLEPDKYYHIYNRTNNKELLFRTEENKRFFLKKYTDYLFPYVQTFAYCLLDNHFHFLVKIRPEERIRNYINTLFKEEKTKLLTEYLDSNSIPVSKVLENQFLRLFTSYAMAFNKQWGRKGNLFNRPFKRLSVQNENHFTTLVIYMHLNPIKHNITENYKDYSWSSYQSIVTEKPTRIERDEILNWFGNKKAFISAHNEENFDTIEKYLIEE